MTAREAKLLLESTPLKTSDKPSRINKSMTCKEAVEIVSRAVNTYPDDKVLDLLMEKRVTQVTQNRCRCMEC